MYIFAQIIIFSTLYPDMYCNVYAITNIFISSENNILSLNILIKYQLINTILKHEQYQC